MNIPQQHWVSLEGAKMHDQGACSENQKTTECGVKNGKVCSANVSPKMPDAAVLTLEEECFPQNARCSCIRRIIYRKKISMDEG